MGSSTGCIDFLLFRVLMVFTNCGCLQQLFPLTLGMILVIGWAAQYVIDGGPGLGQEL